MNGNRDEIQKAIDGIEPAAGARERMLANIQRKAAQQAPQTPGPEKEHRASPRRTWKWAAAACLAVAVLSAILVPGLLREPENPDPSPSGQVEVPNPFTPIDGPEDIRQQLGFRADAPQGAQDVQYSVVNGTLANIVFTWENHAYCLRAAKLEEDFSGLNGEVVQQTEIDPDTGAVHTVLRSGEDLYHKITWMAEGAAYILTNTDGAPEDQVRAVYAGIQENQ